MIKAVYPNVKKWLSKSGNVFSFKNPVDFQKTDKDFVSFTVEAGPKQTMDGKAKKI